MSLEELARRQLERQWFDGGVQALAHWLDDNPDSRQMTSDELLSSFYEHRALAAAAEEAQFEAEWEARLETGE